MTILDFLEIDNFQTAISALLFEALSLPRCILKILEKTSNVSLSNSFFKKEILSF